MSTSQVTNNQMDQDLNSSSEKAFSSPMMSMVRAFGSLMLQGANMEQYLKEILQEGEELETQGEELSSMGNFSEMYQEVGDIYIPEVPKNAKGDLPYHLTYEGNPADLIAEIGEGGVAGAYAASIIDVMGPDADDPTSSSAQEDYSQAMSMAAGEEDLGKGLVNFVQGEISNFDGESSALLNIVQSADTSQTSE